MGNPWLRAQGSGLRGIVVNRVPSTAVGFCFFADQHQKGLPGRTMRRRNG